MVVFQKSIYKSPTLEISQENLDDFFKNMVWNIAQKIEISEKYMDELSGFANKG